MMPPSLICGSDTRSDGKPASGNHPGCWHDMIPAGLCEAAERAAGFPMSHPPVKSKDSSHRS